MSCRIGHIIHMFVWFSSHIYHATPYAFHLLLPPFISYTLTFTKHHTHSRRLKSLGPRNDLRKIYIYTMRHWAYDIIRQTEYTITTPFHLVQYSHICFLFNAFHAVIYIFSIPLEYFHLYFLTFILLYIFIQYTFHLKYHL